LARRLAYKIPDLAQFELPHDAAVHPDARRIRSRVAFRLAKTWRQEFSLFLFVLYL
jgi:hypothetical protein